jgi:hypothetical protein
MAYRATASAVATFVRDRYLTLDRRVLGVFRIGFGFVLLADVLGRLAHATFLFSNEGCLSNHYSLYAPMARPQFSLYVAFSSPGEIRAALAATAVVFASYLVGYRTRPVQILTFVLYTSLNARNLFVENGGTVLMGIVAAWTVFLPLGDRFSVDALLAPKLGTSSPPPNEYVTLAALGIVLQTATIYTFNVLHKTGSTWGSGEVIHLVLWQNRIATSLAAWLRLHEPMWFSPLLTKATLTIESSAPLLILSPIWQRYTRTLSFILTTLLHAGIALLVSLGPFSYVMIALNLLLVPREAVDWVAKRLEGGRLQRGVSGAKTWTVERLRLLAGESRVADLTPFARGLLRLGVWLREATMAILLVAIAVQVTNDNEAVPRRFRLERPGWLAAIIDYPRLFQGWSMFAPDAPESDGTVVIDAVTADRRRLDPFTGRRPDLDAPLHGPFYSGALLCDYFGRIYDAADYHEELRRYLMNWQAIEDRPEGDRLVSLTAYWVTSEAPRPGKTRPRNITRTVMFKEPPDP